MIDAFTVTLLKVAFQKQSYSAFWCNEAQRRGCWRLLCYAMPPPSTTITAHSSRWNERSASLCQAVQMRGRDDNGSFPLGSHGCSIGQKGDKQERGSVLESTVRLPTIKDMITASQDPVDDENYREISQSCASSTENKFILWVELCLCFSSSGSTD